MVKLYAKTGKSAEGEDYKALKAIEDEAISKTKGVHNITDSAYIEKHTRKVIYNGSMQFSPATLLKDADEIDQPLGAIVEYVFSPTLLSVYIKRFNT